MNKDWMLTDQEKTECDNLNYSYEAAQAAKKHAYIKAGGIILNPDALEDMYEALKGLVNTYIINPGTKDEFVSLREIGVPPRFEAARQALSKARGE